jgi:RNA ligase
MKHYHTIEKYTEDIFGKHVFGFNKIDGSNFCAEWNKKLSKKSRFTYGFKKFGTRTETIKNASNPFTEGVNVFMDKYAISLDKIFCENKLFRGIDTITVYGEFYGPHSFAGQHDWYEDHDVIIYDIFLYKKDFVKPADFIDIFGYLDIPKVVYKGLLDEYIINNIISNIYGVKEGVVLKGVNEGKVWMAKVKTQEWLDKVRAMYGENNNLE